MDKVTKRLRVEAAMLFVSFEEFLELTAAEVLRLQIAVRP